LILIDLKKLQQLLQRNQEEKDYPKHVILNLFPLKVSVEKKAEEYKKHLDLVDEIINLQVLQNIPIVTLSFGKPEDIPDQNMLVEYCQTLLEKANEHKINITIFGRWYDLMGELVEALKKVNNETNDFDHFFLNICINYDSKQEIADATRVIIRKILLEKLDIDSITPEILKENIYSSNFIPPDLIIEPSAKFSGTFLFDSPNAKIFFLQKEAIEINKSDVEKALEWYSKKD